MIRKRTSSFKPRVEVLEERCCLAAPSGGTVPPGTIYYSDMKLQQDPNGFWTESFDGYFSMKADGTGKTLSPYAVPAEGSIYLGEPSHKLHGARWILNFEPVAGTYPNGAKRSELFATRADNGQKLQLTNDPSVQPDWSVARWAADDSFVSFAAVTWTPVTSGGNFTDQWLVDAGIFRSTVTWTSGTPNAATPTEALDGGFIFETSGNPWGTVAPDIHSFDWSPNGTQVAYDQWGTQISPGVDPSHHLRVTTFDASGTPINTTQLGTGHDPEWAPDGSRIAYRARNTDLAPNDVIWTVKPDGTGVFQVTNTSQNYDRQPDWSPDSKQIAFTRSTQSTTKGSTKWLKDVLRVAATGGTPVNLTKDVSDNTYVSAWRADVQALTASTIGPGTTQTLYTAEVEPLLAEALARWTNAGVDTSGLGNLQIQVSNLGGTTLGLASGNTIWLDDNAAGWGWFVDATPRTDSEFTTFGDQGEQNRMDLLTVVMHELGHLLGHDHDADSVMAESLTAGVRRTDVEHDHGDMVDQVFAQSDDYRPDARLGFWLTEQWDPTRLGGKQRR